MGFFLPHRSRRVFSIFKFSKLFPFSDFFEASSQKQIRSTITIFLFFATMLQGSRKTGNVWKNWKLKTAVYRSERGTNPPFCPTLVPTSVASSLLEKAALRRLIFPQLVWVLWAVEIAGFAFCAGFFRLFHFVFFSCGRRYVQTGLARGDSRRAFSHHLDLYRFISCVSPKPVWTRDQVRSTVCAPRGARRSAEKSSKLKL